MPQILNRSGDNAAPARGANDVVEGVFGQEFDDGGGDGAEGAFSRADEVCGGGFVAEGVGLVGDGEVVHFVVHYHACFGDHEV